MEGNHSSNEFTGAIARIEDRPKQLTFARVAGLNTIMIDTYRAERLLEQGETAASLFPEASVILTTTFEDERLELWFLEREIDVAVRFGADAVVPCDIPIYEDDPPQQRLQDTDVYVGNIERAVTEFDEHGVEVIPLVKGETACERRLCYQVFEQAAITQVALYCAQFFLYGPRYHDLLARVRNIVREFDPESIMLVGFQSENWLPDFPPAVQAAAGFRWFWQSKLNQEPVAVAHRNYNTWEPQVNAALHTGQTLLDSFTEQSAVRGI